MAGLVSQRCAAGFRCVDCEGHNIWYTSLSYWSNFSWAGDRVIVEGSDPMGMERFYHRMMVITQNNFIVISSDPSLWGDEWTHHANKMLPSAHSVTEPPDPPQCTGQQFRPVSVSPCVPHTDSTNQTRVTWPYHFPHFSVDKYLCYCAPVNFQICPVFVHPLWPQTSQPDLLSIMPCISMGSPASSSSKTSIVILKWPCVNVCVGFFVSICWTYDRLMTCTRWTPPSPFVSWDWL